MTASPVAAVTVSFNPESRLYIDGRLRESSTGKTADNINPATEEVLGVCSDAGAEDMDEAIAAARRAFDTTDWSTNHDFRQHCLMQLHEALQEEKEDMRAELDRRGRRAGGDDLHRPTGVAAGRRGPLAGGVHLAVRLGAELDAGRQDGRRRTTAVVVKEPMGVVGAITPWNFPFEIISNKMGQILATGNTMVLKPAIETPWSALRWGRIIAEKTDIPAGVVNIVPASDNDVAQLLATDPAGRHGVVHRFDGGRQADPAAVRRDHEAQHARAGRQVGVPGARRRRHGHGALPGCIGALMHSGQGCALATRMLVPRQFYDQAVEVATATFGALAVGDPADPATSAARWCRRSSATGC